MGFVYRGIPDQGSLLISYINNIFLIIFHLEALLKLLGLGFFYFKHFWNKFDFIILLVTDIIILESIFYNNQDFATLPIIARALRLGKLVKYIRESQSLRVLMDSIYFLLPALINIACLIILVMFIYCILGMNIFGQIKIEPPATTYP